MTEIKNQRAEAQRFAEQAPTLNEEELERINALFTPYLFRRTRTGEVWTTCCRRYDTPDIRSDVFLKEHQREPRWWNEHDPKPSIPCPLCGRLGIVKELRFTGRRYNLTSWRRAVVLRWHEGALWAMAYDCRKSYTDALTNAPECHLLGIYCFRPGFVKATKRYFWDYPLEHMSMQSGPLTKRRWQITGPWNANAQYGVGYDVIGLEEIGKSPLRYCMAEKLAVKTNYFLQVLTACCFYPRQIEMLMKAEMERVVLDLAERGVKHAAVLRWEAENPTQAIKMDKQELRAFLATSRDIRIAELYIKMKKHVPMSECADWIAYGVDTLKICKAAKKWSIAPEKLTRYLRGFVGCARCGGLSGLPEALRIWQDYVDAAEALGYALHRENVLMPKNLGSAHDSASKKNQKRLEEERKKEKQEQKKLMAKEYEVRKKKLEKKYAFAMDGYQIRVPESKEEILAEGRALKHCVGGYADRHMLGYATILFMRRTDKPEKPWLTIEMYGNRLVQIHGYRNEGIHTSEGRIAPDPNKVYAEWLDIWLCWLKAGSKREKDGQPKLPKTKGAAA